MKYAIEMSSGAMIYIPRLIKIGSGIQKLIGGIHRQQGYLISLILFFSNKESRLIKITALSSEFFLLPLLLLS
jgi:hypothetical protein